MSELRHKGPIAWMVNNPVAANLLMALCLAGGLLVFTQIKQEVFPDMTDEVVTVRVGYPGGTPEEMEQGVCLVVEEAVRGLEGVKEVTAVAGEGSATISAELLDGVDVRETIRNWHEGRVYVRESRPVRGKVGSVIVIFDGLAAVDTEVPLNALRLEIVTDSTPLSREGTVVILR